MDLQNICTRQGKKWCLKGTSSEEAESDADIGKPGMEEHLTFGIFKDDDQGWHISSGKLRLLEEREFSSEDYMPAMQSRNNIN